MDSRVLSFKGEQHVLLLAIPPRQLVSEPNKQTWVQWLIYEKMATSLATMIMREWFFQAPN